MRVVVYQPAVPGYRVSFFDALSERTDLEVRSPRSVPLDGSVRTSDDAVQASWWREGKALAHAGLGLYAHRDLWRSSRRADVVVAELNPRAISTWLLLVARRLGVVKPVVLWGHASGRDGASNRWRGRLAQSADLVLAYTQDDARTLSAAYPKASVVTLGNALYAQKDLPAQGPAERRDFLFVGRLSADKCVDKLIQAFALLVARQPSKGAPSNRLIIVGDGPEAGRLRESVPDHAKPFVTFSAAVFGAQELAPYYQQAIAAISPGYAGLSAVQACSFGVPLILPREACHAPEVIGLPPAALLWVDDDDESSLAEAMEQQITSAAAARLAADAADLLAFARTHLTIDVMVDNFLSAMSSLGLEER